MTNQEHKGQEPKNSITAQATSNNQSSSVPPKPETRKRPLHPYIKSNEPVVDFLTKNIPATKAIFGEREDENPQQDDQT